MYALNTVYEYTEERELMVAPEECTAEDAGGKGYNLRRVSEAGFAVPKWFAISPAAIFAGKSAIEKMQLRTADNVATIKDLTKNLGPSSSLIKLVQATITAQFGNQARLAVRSSAQDEDGQSNSFAGQLDSVLNVCSENIGEAIAKVWRSAYSQRNLSYRQLRGARLIPEPPAVLIQLMCEPDFAGVAFSCDPVTGNRNEVVINSIAGLAEGLVSGEQTGDCTYVCAGRVDSLRNSPNLPKEFALKIADAANRLEAEFGSPQDVEWAICKSELVILQSRPITTISKAGITDNSTRSHGSAAGSAGISPCEKDIVIWDNSNIGESYPGVTTPLTFSFARTAYENAYLQFCKLMGVPQSSIETNSDVFPRMIGFVNGRIYYNLLSWYQVLSILPGYSLNRKFMEQMMGVAESLPASLVEEIAQRNSRTKLLDAALSARTICQTVANLVLLQRQISRFNVRFERAMNMVPAELSTLSAVELVALYRALERQLLTKWDAPLTNDFFAMIFYGALKALCTAWCADSNATLQNGLLTGISDVISTVPAELIEQLTEIVKQDAVLLAGLNSDSDLEIISAARAHQTFSVLFDHYIERFGDRCAGELKLETSTLRDNPAPLLKQIGHAAKLSQTQPSQQQGRIATNKQDAMLSAEKHLKGNLVKNLIFKSVLKQARERIRQRENLRFQRTRIFGIVRRIFKAIGTRMVAQGLINSESDIFYLEVSEILGTVDGTITTRDLKSLIELRKRENQHYSCAPIPQDRIETHDEFRIAHHQSRPAVLPKHVTTLKGTGCSPGKVTGTVRVLHDPNPEIPLNGKEIVVADRTDPGWILVFPHALGLVVEHGSLLSHSAIVSRELGLPAVISVPDVTRQLKDGDLIEIDGTTGIINILERNPQ